MQAGVFDNDCDHHATDKHHRSVVHITGAGVGGIHYAHQWIENDRN